MDELYGPTGVMASATWLSQAAGTTFQWDSRSGRCYPMEGQKSTTAWQSCSFQFKENLASLPPASSYWTTQDIGPAPGVPPQAIAWETEATQVIFALDPALLAGTTPRVVPKATGALRWRPVQVQSMPHTLGASPVLFGSLPYETSAGEPVTIVPSIPTDDPLCAHIALVLQTAVEAEDTAAHLYAETLAEAVVMHFLRRYASAKLTPQSQDAAGLLPYKLQRTLAYIQTHLNEKLPMKRLATVAQMSPTHFAHLFKHSTGLPPHKYVSRSRVEQAKQLLGETDMSLSEIAHQVGCADQSHFTALFRGHTTLTPKVYRNVIQQTA